MKSTTLAILKSPILSPYSLRVRPLSFAWLYLVLAIVSEVIGLTVMKAMVLRGYVAGYVVLYLLIALSYIFLSKAVKTISIGVAYAVWEGSGIALMVFQNVLTIREWFGLAMAVTGILMVNAGEGSSNA